MTEVDDHNRGEIAPGVRLDDFLPYLLNRIANRLNMALAEDMKAIGVSVPEYRVLAVLMAGDGRSVNELSVYTTIEQSTLSKLLVRMESAGLVTRCNDAADGRVVNVYSTEAGRAACAQIVPVALKHYRMAIGGLGEDERKTLIRTLHRVLDNIRISPFP
jgi:DNA-binding MarR family transcriptional regulator